jgi:uncharacterized protein
MLRVDVRELRKGPVETNGLIPATDELFAGLDLGLIAPLGVSGTLGSTGTGDFRWRGRLAGQVMRSCRRCDRPFVSPVDVPVEALFSSNPDLEDDPSVYPLPETASHVDVTGAVREELILAIPPLPLCREDCAGLCRACGADLNQGPCECLHSAHHQ